MAQEKEQSQTTAIFIWEKVKEDGEGKLILLFNGPGLIEHAKQRLIAIPEEAVEVLEGYSEETEAEGFSPEDIDWLFIIRAAVDAESTNEHPRAERIKKLIEIIQNKEPRFRILTF